MSSGNEFALFEGTAVIIVCGHWNGCLLASNHVYVWGQLCRYLLAAVNKTRWKKICALFASERHFQPSWFQFISITCLVSLTARALTVFCTQRHLDKHAMRTNLFVPKKHSSVFFGISLIISPSQNNTIVTFKNCKWLHNSYTPSHRDTCVFPNCSFHFMRTQCLLFTHAA